MGGTIRRLGSCHQSREKMAQTRNPGALRWTSTSETAIHPSTCTSKQAVKAASAEVQPMHVPDRLPNRGGQSVRLGTTAAAELCPHFFSVLLCCWHRGIQSNWSTHFRMEWRWGGRLCP